ncbi:MAG: RNA methyltransferase, partial [Bdellovibrionales bacterium]|nr:RNA methyltransferase [Bdellovibrionales bacterium]
MSTPEELDPYFFKKSVLNMDGPFCFSSGSYSAEEIVQALGQILTEERKARIEDIVAKRSLQFIPVMENIYDRGNISAVMRSAEAFGFLRCHIIEAENAKFKAANRVTKGADKWLDVKVFRKPQESVTELRKNGFQIFATHLHASKSISEIDFSRRTAIVLGNEKEGVSDEMVSLCDGNVIIPMQGFSQSFNISVAAALLFYHTFQERVKIFERS